MDGSRTMTMELDTDELTHTQLTNLLEDAEARIRAKKDTVDSGSAESQSERSKDLKRFSQLLDIQNGDSSLAESGVSSMPAPYLISTGETVSLDQSRLLDSKNRDLIGVARRVEDPVTLKERNRKIKTASTGSQWFDMPQTVVTPELRRDLQLLRMRSVIDPKRHYKKESTTKGTLIPAYSQVGVIKEGPTEFFSARISKKDRKKTFVEEVLAKHDLTSTFKRKYESVQTSKTSGRKSHYQSLKAKRSGGK